MKDATQHTIPPFRYVHSNVDIKRVSKLLDAGVATNALQIPERLKGKKDQAIQELLDYRLDKEDEKTSNLNRLLEVLKRTVKKDDDSGEMEERYWSGERDDKSNELYEPAGEAPKDPYIPFSQVFWVPEEFVNKYVQEIVGNIQDSVQPDSRSFIQERLAAIMRDPAYVPTQWTGAGGSSPDNLESAAQKSLTYGEVVANATVILYSKALRRWINLTPFIIRLNTNHTMQGDSFIIDLAPRPFALDYSDSDSSKIIDGINFLDYGLNSNDIRVNYFQRYISQNDLIYIKHEQLGIERANRDKLNFITADNAQRVIINGYWDLIGLVDVCIQSVSASTADISLQVTGRDFTKAVQEDQSFFIPNLYAFTNNPSITNLQDSTKGAVRRIFNGAFANNIALRLLKTIQMSLGFILNIIMNVGWVPNEVFNAYGDRRNKSYKWSGETPPDDGEYYCNGIWSITYPKIDGTLVNRYVLNDGLTNAQGPIIGILNTVCQQPFVEWFFDTVDDEVHLVVRRPPYTQNLIKDYINGSIETKAQPMLDKDGREVEGKKIIVGREIEGKPSIVITIAEREVLQEQLQFETEGIYTWLELSYNKPWGRSDSSFTSLAYKPFVYLTKYVEHWGVRKATVETNYVLFDNEGRMMTSADNLSGSLDQELSDFIDYYAPLPFTRKGTITINADRRVRKGMWIRYARTGELFYVTGVSHSLSFSMSGVDATTTITVARGMVEDYIKGKRERVDSEDLGNGVEMEMSYFDIVDKDTVIKMWLDFRSPSASQRNETGGTNVSKSQGFGSAADRFNKNGGVNVDVFNFFMQRRQFNNMKDTL